MIFQALLAVLLSLAATSSPAAGQPLHPGPPMRQQLSPGEVREYRIADAEDARLRAAVQEDGRDLVLELILPGDVAPVVVASPGNRYGIDSILFKPGAGDYRLRVHEAEPGTSDFHFTLGLEALAGDTAADRSRLRAEELTTAALQRWAEDTPDGRKAALALFQAAQPLWEPGARDPERVMNLVSSATLHRLANEHEQALKDLTAALQIPIGDPRIEAVILIDMGWAEASLGRVEKARDFYHQALKQLDTLDDPYAKASALNNLGLTYHNRNDLRTARELYEQALPLYHAAGDLRTEAVATSNLGGIHQQLGEPGLAMTLYQRAVDIESHLAGDSAARDQARALSNMGAVQLEIGLYEQARAFYLRSLDLARREGDQDAEARALTGLGIAGRALGDLSGAVDSLNASLALRRQVKDQRGEAATLVSLGRTARDNGTLQPAVTDFERALEIQRSLGDRRAEAMTLQPLAEAHQALGQTDQALDLITRSVAALRALDARRPLCAALRQQSEILTARADAEPGAAAAREALGLCRATQDQPGEAQALLALAKAERALGQLPAAEGHAEEALGAVESMRAGIASPDLRASFLSRLQDSYGLAIDLLMQRHRLEPAAGFDRQALAMAERARARGLLDLLREAGTDVRQGIDPALLERRAHLEERLTAKSRHHLDLLDRPPGDPERAATEKELQEILAGLETVDGEIRTRSPRYAALTRPHPLDAAGIQNLLDPTTLLLVYRLGEPKSYLWAVSPSAVTSFELPAKREIEDAARAVYGRWKVRDLAARREDEAAAARLSAMILGPAAGLLRDQRLAVVADGALEYLPFAALPFQTSGGTEPLVVHHEIVSLPSASVLALLRQEAAGRPAPPDRIAVVADPVFRADDPRVPAASNRDLSQDAAFDRLVWSRSEAEAIARIAAPRPALVDLDFDANLDAVAGGKLRGYRIVHLATHGVLDSERPALSGLVLSLVDHQGKPRPGLLRLGDIYNLSLDADLVVLSGCQTALGKQIRGEGLIGLTRGFLYAGADRVMSSLWRVQDRATAELMTRFYRALLTSHLPPPAALRSAQLAMLHDRRWSLPYDWAGFVVYGDWSDWQSQ